MTKGNIPLPRLTRHMKKRRRKLCPVLCLTTSPARQGKLLVIRQLLAKGFTPPVIIFVRAEQSPRNRGKIESGGKKDCTEGNALFFFNSFELFDFLHDFFLKSRSTVYGFMWIYFLCEFIFPINKDLYFFFEFCQHNDPLLKHQLLAVLHMNINL